MCHPLAATTQCPAVRTALELMRMPLHEPMLCPDSLRRSMTTLAGLLDDETSTSRPLEPLLHATKVVQERAATDAPTPIKPTRTTRFVMMTTPPGDGAMHCTREARHEARAIFESSWCAGVAEGALVMRVFGISWIARYPARPPRRSGEGGNCEYER
jgi:hypothetical protein